MEPKDITYYKKRKLPVWIKAVLLKAWFAGAVYFFIGLGLFINTTDQLDITIAIGLVLGLITDVIVNKMFRGMARSKNEYHPFMMLPEKTIFNFVLNLFYGILLSFLVAYTYNFINVLLISIKKLPDTAIVLGAEPVLFGILCMAYDMGLLQIKKLVVKIKKEDVLAEEKSTAK